MLRKANLVPWHVLRAKSALSTASIRSFVNMNFQWSDRFSMGASLMQQPHVVEAKDWRMKGEPGFVQHCYLQDLFPMSLDPEELKDPEVVRFLQQLFPGCLTPVSSPEPVSIIDLRSTPWQLMPIWGTGSYMKRVIVHAPYNGPEAELMERTLRHEITSKYHHKPGSISTNEVLQILDENHLWIRPYSINRGLCSDGYILWLQIFTISSVLRAEEEGSISLIHQICEPFGRPYPKSMGVKVRIRGPRRALPKDEIRKLK
eukprot:s297_g12.t1